MEIKAIAFDLDGTILDARNQIQPELIKLISDLKQREIKIFLATGRTRKEVEDILPYNFPFDGAVTSNGMVCYTKDKNIVQRKISSRLVKKIINLARQNNIFYVAHSLEGKHIALSEDSNYMKEEIKRPMPKSLGKNEIYSLQNFIESKITWVRSFNYDDIVKLYFFSMSENKIKRWKVLLNQLKETNNFSTSSSSLHNVEVMEEDISKATGLNSLLTKFNLNPNQLMAIGDGGNDIPMFELSSLAVAMANAPQDVKDKADVITKYDYENSGVYSFLKSKQTQKILNE